VTGEELAELLESAGWDFFTGVPCSLVEGVIAALETRPRLPYVPAVREDVAVGVAAGAFLGGRSPAVLMQNSGLGTSLNALVSLSLMYRLPALLLVTWRGYQGKDAPEHLLMGEISPPLLALMGIPHRVPSAASIRDDVAWARAEAARRSQPVALLLPPGVVGTEAGGHRAIPPPAAPPPRHAPDAGREPGEPGLSRFEALGAALAAIDDEPVVHANGYICRESFSIRDRAQNFYMIGSMGLASSIGLGVALAVPRRKTVVFDGDGNLLMSLGILPMVGGRPVVGGERPANLVHVVFDNGVYGSTGNQLSPSRHVGLDRVALASGYETATAVSGHDEIARAIAAALAGRGPAFILARVTAEEHPAPRIPYSPEQIRDRFRAALAGP